ncbi:unnamed protein product [Ostreobium quekettii]|uniref:TLC domain-containing protein n=1 Tax=Ostreobium quekettii TaxID=121088 RepID=A0A8S1IKS3_9CHLO|nr:unnamed protein product [Ostreobium quekettii]|eukprot:evm.model.scf_93.7 EVM.evm.TU.scf_93.7   scf_93:105706-106823(+)
MSGSDVVIRFGHPPAAFFISILTYGAITVASTLTLRLWGDPQGGSTPRPQDTPLRASISLASLVHACVMTVVGTVVTFGEDWSTKHIVYGQSPLVPFFVAWEVGYLLEDLAAMAYSKMAHDRWAGWSLALHHAFLITGLPYYFGRRVQGDYIWGSLFFMNASSVCWHLRYFIARGGWEGSRLHAAVSMAFPLTFLVCRFLFMPFAFWQYGRLEGLAWHDVPLHIPPKCLLGLGSISVFNVYWLVKMGRNVAATLGKAKTKRS